MRREVFRGYEGFDSINKVKKVISFAPFITYLEEKISKNVVNKDVLIYSIKKIKDLLPENLEISEVELDNYFPVYEIVFQLLNPPVMEEMENFWGMSIPFSPTIFYSTDDLSKLMESGFYAMDDYVSGNDKILDKELIKQTVVYGLVLNQLYNIDISRNELIKYCLKPFDQEDKFIYYGIEYMSNFINVEYEGELPTLNVTDYACKLISIEHLIDRLKTILPFENITLKGFTIFKIRDITREYLKNKLNSLVISSSLNKKTPHHVFAQIFKGLLGNYNLDILLSTLLTINQNVVQDLWQGLDDDFNAILAKYKMPELVFKNMLKDYTKEPQTIYHKDLKTVCKTEENKLFPLFDSTIEGVIVRPVFSKQNLIGAIAIFSDRDNEIDEGILVKLEDVMPLLEKLFESGINSYMSQLNEVIKNKFTFLQLSVEWKFTNAAIKYLHDKRTERHPPLMQIHFENVYPIYGAIDIRNSTIERNKANAQDYKLQLQSVIELLQHIQTDVSISLIGELIFKCKKWIESIPEEISSDREPELVKFLDKEIDVFLNQFGYGNEYISRLTQDYLNELRPDGKFHKNVNDIEKTFKILNSAIASLLDQMNEKVQETYPCFFERYRSDGLEYNFYIGQSITPKITYSELYLRNLQLWQVNTMAIIAKITEELQSQLPHPLRTTQLIFIHSNTIDISFRNDEHRFDVEGSYNIRYEIIKKRIDKAIVKDTQERLTQPGKVAIVYFFRKDVEEYISHIRYLQDKGIFESVIEDLELEDLQGVSGLRAIRVSIKKNKELDYLPNAAYLEENLAIAHEAVNKLN